MSLSSKVSVCFLFPLFLYNLVNVETNAFHRCSTLVNVTKKFGGPNYCIIENTIFLDLLRVIK
jgi:hypothetical protein